MQDEDLRKCKKYFEERDFEGVVRTCDGVLGKDKDDETALCLKVNALEYLEMSDEVLECSNHAINVYPNNPIFYFSRARVLYWDLKDIAPAIESFEKGLALGDGERYWGEVQDLIFALEDEAEIFVKSGKFKMAIGDYERILFYRPSQFAALDEIDAIACEHGIDYIPGEAYEKSLELKRRMDGRLKRIDSYLASIEIGEHDKDYVEGCRTFKDYASIDEYIADIIVCLMDAYPRYSEESSKNIVKYAMENVKEAYEHGRDAYDIAIECGYGCG